MKITVSLFPIIATFGNSKGKNEVLFPKSMLFGNNSNQKMNITLNIIFFSFTHTTFFT